MKKSEAVAMATQVAFGFLGTPYKWGGNDPMAGFDCSGFCIEILKSVGLLPRGGDWTANHLWEMHKDAQIPIGACKEGCLVFWENKTGSKVIHIEYAINDQLCIGASGGGGATITVQDAIEQDAYIKVRPFASRSNIRGVCDPFRR